jgi:glycosyltransferase involved in cell wall biosynthesis
MSKSFKKKLPFVSICTPTFNRRPFIPYMIACYQHQIYPQDRMEWIIVDDGTDPIEDLVKDIPGVKYYRYTEKLLLGRKRNLMHSFAKGDIIVYMDDDDYYPPTRVSHAVETLSKSSCLIAGSSEMHIYFSKRDAIYQFGPYGPNHSTAAAFAFKKELLSTTRYNETSSFAEESSFLKSYSIPMVQLNPLKTILVFSHKHNSLSKEELLEKPELTKVQLSRFKVDDFVKEASLKQFYMTDVNDTLKHYKEGGIEYKHPNLVRDLEVRKKEMENRNQMLDQNRIIAEFNRMKSDYEEKLNQKNKLVDELFKKVRVLTEQINKLEKQQTAAHTDAHTDAQTDAQTKT